LAEAVHLYAEARGAGAVVEISPSASCKRCARLVALQLILIRIWWLIR